MQHDDDITTSHAARILEVAEGTVRQMERRGELPARRVGRLRLFNRSAVEQLKLERDLRTRGVA